MDGSCCIWGYGIASDDGGFRDLGGDPQGEMGRDEVG